jgi:type II secretion system protein N
MKNWLSAGFLGSIWAGVVFNLGIIGAFPREDVERWAEYQVQEASQGEYLIDLNGTQFLGLGGVSTTLSLFKGELTRKRGRFSKNKASATQTPPVHSFTIDDAHFRPLILPLLTGRLMVGYDVEVAENNLEGAVGVRGTKVFWSSDTEDFDLTKVPLNGDGWSAALAGSLNLLADVIHDTEDPKQSSGHIEVRIDGLELTQATISGFELMATKFSEAVLRFDIEDGKATVTEGKFVGDLLEIQIEGDIRLRKKLERSRLALTIKIKLDDSLDKFAQMDPSMKRARDSDGFYNFRGSGTLANPNFRANGARSTAADRGDDTSFSKPKRESGDRSISGSDDRRKQRKDRIKKRRERMKERRRKRRDRSGGSEEDRPDPSPRSRYQDDSEEDFEQEDETLEDMDDDPRLPPIRPPDPYDDANDNYDEPENLPNDLGYVDE